MRFKYIVNSKIPQSAWCAEVVKGSDVVTVELGSSVPHNDKFFVSGVWDGKFEEGDFKNAQFACCTGGVVDADRLELVTPNHLLESIYGICVGGGKMLISNSLAFVMERTEANMNPDYYNYQEDMGSSLLGLEGYIKFSPLANGLTLNYYRCCNISINSNLDVSVETRKSGLHFDNYDEYISSVRRILSDIASNSQDPMRPKPYDMITTVSRGYDACAVSALAREIGCSRAFTFGFPEQYEEDNGKEVAEKLGYETIYVEDAYTYRNQKFPGEAEIMSVGDIGSNMLQTFKKRLGGSMIFLGTRGDSLWERNHGNVNNQMDFTVGNTLQQISHSCVEMALEQYSVFIHLPMIGSDKWTEIAEISNSDEMRPWSVREYYDRPIARRIVEEKGVSRDAFGRNKHGMGVSYHFDTFKMMLGKMSATSKESIMKFKKNYKHNPLKQLLYSLKFYKNEFPVYFNYIAHKLRIPLSIKYKGKYISSPYSTLLIIWATDEMRKRYRL